MGACPDVNICFKVERGGVGACAGPPPPPPKRKERQKWGVGAYASMGAYPAEYGMFNFAFMQVVGIAFGSLHLVGLEWNQSREYIFKPPPEGLSKYI